MLSKSTNRYWLCSTFERLILLLFVVLLVECQPECSAKTFPAVVPIRNNETLVVNLQDYFQGSNLSYSIIPNTSTSYVDRHFQCESIGSQSIGRVVASEYLSRDGVEIVAILAQSPVQIGVFAFYYIQIELMTVTTLPLNDSRFRNCSDFQLIFLNSTHFQVIINCRYTPQFFTYALVSTIAKLSTIDPQWTYFTSPLYSLTAISDMKLQVQRDILLRGVRSSSNSYVQVWSWSGEAREVIGVIDKTILQIGSFNLQQMKHYGNILVLLDFQTGLHILRVNNRKKYTVIATFLQPFYEGFDYNPSTGLIYLFKKGKTISMIIESIEHQNLFVSESFSTFKYESILKIIEWQNRLITLGEQFLSVFSLSDLKNEYNSNIYSSQKTVNFFLRNKTGQSIELLLIQNRRPTVSYMSCRVRTPYLHLAAPETSMEITVFGSSLINGESSVCRQSFVLERLVQEQSLIYDNGYHAEGEVIYSNLPGLARVEMDRFGVGRNMSYRVLFNPLSKIEYTSAINKAAQQSCSLQNKTVTLGGSFYLYGAWQNVLVTQTTSDKTLRYFFCDLSNGVSCTSKVQLPGLDLIDLYATETIEDTAQYSISYEAFVQQRKLDTEIVVKKVLVLPSSKSIQLSYYCSIMLMNRADEYSNVTQIEIVNSKLFVVMPYRKQIRIFNLLNQCKNIANLTIRSFPGSYFGPRAIYFDHSLSSFRHQIVLIRQWDELLKVRLQGSDLNLPPVVMSRSKLPESTNGSLAVAYPYIVYFSLTNNRAFNYILGDNNELIYLRELPLQGMKFAHLKNKNDDYFEMLDPIHISISLIDSQSKSIVIKVFEIGQLISVASEYLHLPFLKEEQSAVYFRMADGRRPLVRLQLVSGPSVSYLLCKSINIYLNPYVVFNFKSALTSLQNYSENITLSLQTKDDLHTHGFKISLSNIGLAIARGKGFPARSTAIQPATELILNDSNWFSGSIYTYQFDCRDCKNRIKFAQKINKQQKVSIPINSRVFWQEQNGRVINMLTKSFFASIEYNYSAWPIDGDHPTNYGLKSINPIALGAIDCVDIKWVSHYKQIISLCWRYDAVEQQEYFLSVASILSYKAFVIEQMVINFEVKAVPKLQLRDGVIVVYSSKTAILFTLWQIEGSIRFIELDRVDKQDISSPICTLSLVSNSTSEQAEITKKLFGLILTQCTSQIYYLSFSVYLQEQEMIDESGGISKFVFPNIHVSYSQTINLLKLWSQRHIQIPSEANIVQTITKMEVSDFDQQQILTLIVVFDRFHSFQFKVVLSKYIKVIKRITLESIYYKFGSNIATSASLKDYLVIKYVLDVGFGKLEELYGCFDLEQFVLNSDRVKEHYSFAAYRFQTYKSNAVEQDFPWELIGHKITQLHHENLQVLNINNKLIAHIDGLESDDFSGEVQPLYTQSIIVTANNPIGARSATIILQSQDEFILSGLQIGLIVVGCIVFVVVTILLGRVFIVKLKKRLRLVALVGDEKAEDAVLEREEQERAGEYLINISERGSIQP